MSTPAATDEELARRAAAGDRAALGELTVRHRRRLAGYLRTRGVPEGDIDDLMQDVWIKVFRHAAKWDGNMAWVMAIAQNADLDRRKKRRLPTSDFDAGDVVDLRPSNAAPEPDPKLASCLERLRTANGNYHAAVVGFYYGELDDAEIAAARAIEPVTVRTGRSKGIAALKKCLGGEAP